jgi:hypothetical protein
MLGTQHAKLVSARSRFISDVSFGFEHFTATVKACGADVVPQMGFARVGLNGNARATQCVVGTMHAAFRRRFFVLLNGHENSLNEISRRTDISAIIV